MHWMVRAPGCGNPSFSFMPWQVVLRLMDATSNCSFGGGGCAKLVAHAAIAQASLRAFICSLLAGFWYRRRRHALSSEYSVCSTHARALQCILAGGDGRST